VLTQKYCQDPAKLLKEKLQMQKIKGFQTSAKIKTCFKNICISLYFIIAKILFLKDNFLGLIKNFIINIETFSLHKNTKHYLV
jgi:hypothetical protein